MQAALKFIPVFLSQIAHQVFIAASRAAINGKFVETNCKDGACNIQNDDSLNIFYNYRNMLVTITASVFSDEKLKTVWV